MRRFSQLVAVLLSLASFCSAQMMVDRIVATVNRQPVLLSDWEVEMRFEAMLEQKELPLNDEAARAALERLIDQELLRQQIKSYQLQAPTSPEIDSRVAEVRKQLPAADNAAGFASLLNKYGLSEGELRERVATQVMILHFIDVRLRPSVHVERRTIEAYYTDKLLPELRRKGEKPATLAEAAPQIEELLSQQRVDALTNDWLKDLRQQAEIRMEPAAAAQPNANAKQQGRR
jgi:hypothetical protein